MAGKKGFTLVELLVVVAIIALLVSILLPALGQAREMAKMVVCSSNQHQLLLGVTAYSSDHGDFPPSIYELDDGADERYDNFWTYPARLSYRPEHVGTSNGTRSTAKGYMGYYLYDYLPDASVYNCPLANYNDNQKTCYDTVNKVYVDYQDIYKTGNRDWVGASYFMFWNYHGFNSPSNENRFLGPGASSRFHLMVSDMIIWNDEGAMKHNVWQTTHPYKGGKKSGNSLFYESVDKQWISSGVIPLEGPGVNAGYDDGRVERVAYDDLVIQYTSKSKYPISLMPLER